MNISLSRTRRLAVASMWALLCALGLALSGCGGGGNSATTPIGNGSGNGGGGSGGNTNVSTGAATLSGVVAVGSPVLGATISVVDALGVDQGSGVSAITDGSYQLALSTTSRTLPLFIQAVGTDLQGAPVVLHTVVQSLTTGGTTQNVVHITPLTNAVVGMLLGGDPTPFFLNPAGYASWARLASPLALAAASTFLKGIIQSNLQDARLTDPLAVDFFSDEDFAADKTRLDAVLESLRFAFSRNLSDHQVLHISNTLALTGSTEVSIDLTAAYAALSASVPAIDVSTILSTVQSTTGRSSIQPSVSDLNELTAVINLGMAQNLGPFDLAALPIFSSAYASFDGRSGLTTVTQLSNYGIAGYQLSNFQILGCLDDPLVGNGCDKIAVAAFVRNSSGVVVDIFRDVVAYTSTTGWLLRGNGRQTPWSLNPVTWLELDATGSAITGNTANPNPGRGMQVTINALDFMQAIIQTPNNHSLQFYYCNTVTWSPMCLGLTETGDVIDDYVLRSTRIDWVGNIDARPGARYRIQTVTLGNGAENNTTQLSTDLPSLSDLTAYPVPNGLSATAPLTIGDFTAGLTVSWSNWAAAHPQLRVTEVLGVLRSTTSAPIKQSVRMMPLSGTQATLPGFTTIPGDAEAYVLWLIAEDGQGRRYISKITAQP
jgi:hypothetical protein